MLTQFWEGIGKALASEWVKQIYAPAFVFWSGTLMTLVWRDGWTPWIGFWETLSVAGQVAVLVAALIAIAVSAELVRRLEYSALRLLEGYWPDWWGIRWARAKLTDRQNDKLDEAKSKSGELLGKGLDNLSAVEEETFVKADTKLRNAPLKRSQRMPTALGNVLRAAERRPRDRYGLEIVTVWPRLWMLLPEQTRKDVGDARGALNMAVRLVTWGVLFVLWGLVAWWAAIGGLIVVIYAYHWAISQAQSYGDLLEASFDLHRFLLYDAVSWPRPKSSEHEKEEGERLTGYLHRGFAQPVVDYQHPTKS